MYTAIDPGSAVPAYRQIYQDLRSRIIAGAFVRGTRLPSKRVMAQECRVSVITVEHAYQLLCEEGYCEMRPRSGCYVKYAAEDFFPVSAEDGGRNETSEDTPILRGDAIAFSAVSTMLRKVILDHGAAILTKSPNNGTLKLRDAIRRYLSRCRNIDVPADRIVIGSGAEYLYGICIQMLGRDGKVALESPSYEKIRQVYTANGAVCDMLEMDDEGIRPDELARTKATVLHVTPFNSYPSRITASAQRRAAYLKWADERNAVIIEDDYDSEFSVNGRAPETLFSRSASGRVIYLNTFSKTIAPSLRVGYMVLPERLAALYEQTVGFYSCTVPMLEQFFLAEWLDSGEFERTIHRRRNKK